MNAIRCAIACLRGVVPGRACIATPLHAGASLTATADALARRWIDERGAVGTSVVVTRDGETLLSKAYGHAHLEHDVATPGRALYEIGSEAKTFTGAAIMHLVERGKLSLEDRLSKHLAGVIPDAERITLRHLLTHTSGVFEYTAIPEYEAPSTTTLPRERLVELIAAKPLTFEPGTAQSYSNSGYLLLGMVVEKVSGKPWVASSSRRSSRAPVRAADQEVPARAAIENHGASG